MKDGITKTVRLDDSQMARSLYGNTDENLIVIEHEYGVELIARDLILKIKGRKEDVERVFLLVESLRDFVRTGQALNKYELRNIMESLSQTKNDKGNDLSQTKIAVPGRRRYVYPKNLNQQKYIEAMENNDVVFGIGPAGTGKTFLAMAMAVNAMHQNKVERIILVRPAVEAGESLGFLPGDMLEKVNPYLRPLYDALYDMMEPERIKRYMEKGLIEVAPLAFMRGRTLSDSFIVMDEAQNSTMEQMKMFLTRLGFNSKAVITGDVTQVDLPINKASGLVHAQAILKKIPGIQFFHFNDKDVVRHKLVQSIIRAYERHGKNVKDQLQNV
jgi:phosphate starvation-inducible protein PhoH and related proteins